MRELEPSDLEFMAEMLGDREVMRYFPAPLSRQRSLMWIERQMERYRSDGLGYWLIVNRENQRPIGQAGLMSMIVEGSTLLGLGYMLHRPFWQQGYALEASRACLDHAETLSGRPRISCLIRPANGPSRKVADRLGYRAQRMVLYADFAHIKYDLPHR